MDTFPPTEHAILDGKIGVCSTCGKSLENGHLVRVYKLTKLGVYQGEAFTFCPDHCPFCKEAKK
jgi:hypothetical protein